MPRQQKYWFSSKRPWFFYRYTHPPICWQGWVTMAVYVLIFPILALLLFAWDSEPSQTELILFAVGAAINVVGYIVINQLKSQPPPPKNKKG